MDETDEPLPIRSPFIKPALTSGFRLRIVSRMFCGILRESRTFSNVESSSRGLSGCSSGTADFVGELHWDLDFKLSDSIAASTFDPRG